MLKVLRFPQHKPWQVQFDPTGNILAIAGGGSASIKLFKIETWTEMEPLCIPAARVEPNTQPSPETERFVISVAWSLNGKRIACGSMNGEISVFNVCNAKFLHKLDGHKMLVRSLSFSITSDLLFSASDDEHVHMYAVEDGTMLSEMSGHTDWVLSVDVSPDGRVIATGSSDNTVKLWDIGTRAAVQTMGNHKDEVWGVAFRPIGGVGFQAGRLASVSEDKSISLYDYS